MIPVRRRACLASALVLLLAPVPTRASAGLLESLDAAEPVALARVQAEIQRQAGALVYPESTQAAGSGGAWSTRGASGGWTQGFWAGQLWHFAERTGDPAWATRAATATDALAGRAGETNNHDVGFLLLLSHGEGLRVTGDSRYRAALGTAAGSLDTHWLPLAGGYWSFDFNNRGIRAFQNIIIDTTMNLELMFVAAREFDTPAWKARAWSHARLVARDFVRADGSTRQVINYSPTTGQPELPGIRWQGFGVESTWSRGLGWGLRGLAAATRETGDAELLAAARKIATYHRSVAPADGVPHWDYVAPTLTSDDLVARYGTGWTGQDRLARDTSAAALVASGLLELATLDPDPAARALHLAEATRVLRSLATTYLSSDGRVASILAEGSTTFPSVERGTVYGDFYFLEASRRAMELLRPASTFATGDAGERGDWALPEPWRWSVERLDGDVRLRLQRGLGDGARGEASTRARLGAASGAVELELRAEADPAESAAAGGVELAVGTPGSGAVLRLSGDSSRRGLWVRSSGGETRLGDVAALGLPTRWTRVRLAWGTAGWSVEVGGTPVLGPVAAPLPAEAPFRLASDVPLRVDNPVLVGVVATEPPPARVAWREERLGALASGLLGGDLADPDGDGRPNLLEYALGTDPGDASSPGLRLETAPGGAVTLVLPPGAGPRPDVGLVLEWSRDLRTWHEVPVEGPAFALEDPEGVVVRLRATALAY